MLAKMFSLLLMILVIVVAGGDDSQVCHKDCVCVGVKMTCEEVLLKEKDLTNMKIPVEITHLVLISNELDSISETALLNLKKLKSLEISKNFITKIPIFAFRGFDNLRTLKLNDNKIKEISEGSFIGLHNLSELQLNKNSIKSLEPGVFDKLKSIKSIHIKQNEVPSLKNGVFTPLKHLRELFLTENKINEIEDKAFMGMQMEFLALDSNKITSISQSTFQGFKINGKINFLKNPFDCSCVFAMNYKLNFAHLTNKIWGYCHPSKYFKQYETLITKAHEKLDHCSLCDLNPCKNDATCTGNKKSFQCKCKEMYKGDTCDVNICDVNIDKYNKNNNGDKDTIRPDMIPLKQINHTEILIVKERVDNEDDAKKLKILYAMCSFEFIVIICFVVYFMWKRYDEWKLQKKYEHEKSRAILYSIRNQTNAQLAKALVEENDEFPTDLKNMILKGSVPV